MLLTKENNNIKYIGFDAYNYNRQHNTLRDYVELCNINEYTQNSYYSYNYTSWNCNSSLQKCIGIYLGDTYSIENIINAKHSSNNLSTFNKVYFDPLCTYPRQRLNTLTNIKRCIDPTKADSVIISKPLFENYWVKAVTCDRKIEDVLVLYSSTESCYYIIDYEPNLLPNSQYNTIFQTILSQVVNNKLTGLTRYASGLINSGILPSDTQVYYSGKVILLKNNSEITFINNLLNKYMIVTYDTELDKFISTSLQKPTSEDLESLGKMLSSSDESVVGMGIKLLSTFDINQSVCSIGMLIAENYDNIFKLSAAKSVGFHQVLSTLGLDKKDLDRYDAMKIANELYKNSENTEDRENVRLLAKQQISMLVERYAERLVTEKFGNMGFNFTFTIE